MYRALIHHGKEKNQRLFFKGGFEMKKLTLVMMVLAVMLMVGCFEKASGKDRAEALVGLLKGTLGENLFSENTETANLGQVGDTDQVACAAFDVEEMGLCGFDQSGGADVQAVQITQIDVAQRGLYDPERSNVINNPDGTTTTVEITHDGNVYTLHMFTEGYLFFIDNVTAIISIDTLGDDIEENDQIVAFQYTVCMKGGTVLEVVADVDELYDYDYGPVVVTASVTGLPGIFGVDNITDTAEVHTYRTFDDDTDDEYASWQREVYYLNGAHQIFRIVPSDGDLFRDDGTAIVTAFTECLPADMGIDTISDEVHILVNDLEDEDDDELVYLKRVVNFIANDAVLSIETVDLDNNGIAIEDGIVDLVITGTNIPDEENPGELLSIYVHVKVDTKNTEDESDDEALALEIEVTNETTGAELTLVIADVDGDGRLLSGTAKITLFFIPPAGEGESESIELELVVKPQGTNDDSDDLYVSFSLTDNRRNGSVAMLTITPDEPVLNGEDPDAATITFSETYTNGDPKFYATMTFYKDGSAEGEVTLYNRFGKESKYTVTIDTEGNVTVTPV
jgi:hypothetical protein